jgi:hypothetical protein
MIGTNLLSLPRWGCEVGLSLWSSSSTSLVVLPPNQWKITRLGLKEVDNFSITSEKYGDWVCLSICFCTSLSLFWRLALVISVVKTNNTFHSFGFNSKSARSLFSCQKKLKCDGWATRCDVSLLKFTAKKVSQMSCVVVAMLRLQIMNKFNNFQRPVSRGDRFKLTPQSLDS